MSNFKEELEYLLWNAKEEKTCPQFVVDTLLDCAIGLCEFAYKGKSSWQDYLRGELETKIGYAQEIKEKENEKK